MPIVDPADVTIHRARYEPWGAFVDVSWKQHHVWLRSIGLAPEDPLPEVAWAVPYLQALIDSRARYVVRQALYQAAFDSTDEFIAWIRANKNEEDVYPLLMKLANIKIDSEAGT